MSRKIIRLKLEYFGAEDVEMKSNWLRRLSVSFPVFWAGQN